MAPDSRTKRILLTAAAAILISAVVWLIVLESTSYTRRLCKVINTHGYHVSPSDLYPKSYGNGRSISDMIEEDPALIVEYSKACGFPAEIEKTGEVELMLWKMDEERVMVIWLVDNEPELVFIENTKTGAVSPID